MNKSWFSQVFSIPVEITTSNIFAYIRSIAKSRNRRFGLLVMHPVRAVFVKQNKKQRGEVVKRQMWIYI